MQMLQFLTQDKWFWPLPWSFFTCHWFWYDLAGRPVTHCFYLAYSKYTSKAKQHISDELERQFAQWFWLWNRWLGLTLRNVKTKSHKMITNAPWNDKYYQQKLISRIFSWTQLIMCNNRVFFFSGWKLISSGKVTPSCWHHSSEWFGSSNYLSSRLGWSKIIAIPEQHLEKSRVLNPFN